MALDAKKFKITGEVQLLKIEYCSIELNIVSGTSISDIAVRKVQSQFTRRMSAN
jgi:hypothetical protein